MSATDNIVKSLIPNGNAWKVKNHVQKNLNLKIHTAELVNTIRTSKSRGTTNKKLMELVQDTTVGD